MAESYAARPGRADALLDQGFRGILPLERRRCQRLFLGTVRWHGLLNELMRRRLKSTPRRLLHGALRVAGFELIEALREGTAEPAQIVHHAVEWSKTHAGLPEQRLLNAVLRRFIDDLREIFADGGDAALAHGVPPLLWRSWADRWGGDGAAAMARWQAAPSPVYLRWRGETPPSGELFSPTRWPGFFQTVDHRWVEVESLLTAGVAYAQDPFTLRPVELLDPRPGEALLDLCAAPGGKTLLIADRLRELAEGRTAEGVEATDASAASRLVAVDLPGPRLLRLQENMDRGFAQVPRCPVTVLGADVLGLRAAELGHFDGILLDAPCSNTGVIRRRPDVKWRVEAGDVSRCASLQGRLLSHAASLLRPGGRLIYSTCSLEVAENEGVVEAFLAAHPEFSLEAGEVSRPWETDHDGGGAFRLRRLAEQEAAPLGDLG